LRIAFLGVDEVRELDAVLDEEGGRVIADQVPVAVFRVEAQGETARVACRIGRAFLAADGREAQEGLGLLADAVEQPGFGVAADVVGNGEGAIGARAPRARECARG
jgi:hypothetical protein